MLAIMLKKLLIAKRLTRYPHISLLEASSSQSRRPSTLSVGLSLQPNTAHRRTLFSVTYLSITDDFLPIRHQPTCEST